jgi:LysM repeat protein
MHDLEHDPATRPQLDDGTGFWDAVPDSRLDRWRAARAPRHTKAQRDAVAHGAGERRHHTDDLTAGSADPTGSVRVVAATADRMRQATEHVDPLLRRAGAIAIVIAALVPVALSLRSSQPSASALAPTVTAVAPSTSPATTVALAPTSAAPLATVARRVPRAASSTTVVRSATQRATASATATRRAASTVAPSHAAAPATTVATRAIAPVRAASISPRATPRACTNTYRVVFGDAWIVIAGRAHTTLSKLLAANQASIATPIYPGRTLCLPAGAHLSSTTHTTSHTSTSHAVGPVAHVTTTHPTYVPTRSYTRAQVIQIIRDVWPDQLEDHAIFIATRESNLVPTARNFCCLGLFQLYFSVHAFWLSQLGITSADQLLDPRTNARAAYALYQRSGSFAPWGG